MKSIRLRILIYFMSLIMLIGIIFSIGMNNYIDGYYYGKKIEAMNGIIADIEMMYNVSQSADEALMNIEYLGYTFEGKISIFDQDTQLVVFENKRFQYTKGTIIEEITYHKNTAFVYETAYPVQGARWLIYIDKLENDNIAVLQIPVVAIDEAIGTIQGFFNFLLFIVMIIAFMFALILSRNITKPIRELHKVAKSIGSLSFDLSYVGKRKDEIGQLGFTLNDISKELESTIENLKVELERKKSIDLMRRRFVAQVSHELQTPISIISSYVEALSDGIVDDDEVLSYYTVIEDESNKMSQMIKDLLQLSQLEANTLTFKMDKISFDIFLLRILSRYDPVIRRQNIKRQVRGALALRDGEIILENFDRIILGDELRLEQGITNIISNAIKHCDNSIIVTLTESKDMIILSIENTGEPIDEKDLPHLFESFYKGKTSKIKEGTGLGLAIASQIFKKHKVKYSVRNSTIGVVFEIRFEKFI